MQVVPASLFSTDQLSKLPYQEIPGATMVSESLSKRTALLAVLATLADATISVTVKNCTLSWGVDGSCVANLGDVALPVELLFGCAVSQQVVLSLVA